MRSHLKLLGALVIVGLFAVWICTASPPRTPKVFASTSTPITGYLWSDNIGWIDLNCSNSGVCGTNNFGFSVDSSGTMSGYAWSDNIGWVSAQASDVSGCPASPCTPTISTANGSLSGWLKALAADGNGWDGWISLSGSTYGPKLSGANFTGYAWGSDVVGWVDWSQAQTTYSPCTAQYFCSATSTKDQYYTSASCVTTYQQTCSYQCSSGACVPPPAPTGSITVNPALVHQNATVGITWSVSNSTSCEVTGTNGDGPWFGISGAQTSSLITQSVTYTLQCTNALGATSTVGTATVSIAPIWHEL